VERPRRKVRFARLIHRRVRVLGGPTVRTACGGNLSLTRLPRRVVRYEHPSVSVTRMLQPKPCGTVHPFEGPPRPSGEHGDSELNKHQSGVQVACGNCRLPLDERSDHPIEDRHPCPRCGSVGRFFDAQLQGEVGLTSRMTAHRRDSSGSPEGEAVRVSGPGDRVAAADFAPGGSVPYDIAGPAPQGEEGSLETAQLLIQRLRQSGENWDDPVRVDSQDVDCEAWSGERVLPIQVTRVPRARVWENLGRVGKASEQATTEQAVDELMNAMAAKARRLPGVQKTKLVLVLDARDTPAFALQGVVSKFRQRHGRQVVALGFRGVWVVGPTVDLVTRLDR
jgi:hypothetical protein